MSYNILDSIGNTPLVEIRHLNPNPAVRIFAKLEYLNPGGSIKDRAALQMIRAGEASGELTPDKTVIEATSGNTGIGLALVCAVKGYRLLLAMSELASVERQKILKARGADILLTPGHLGTDGAIEEVYRLALENPDKYFMADQFNNSANWKAHYYGTAPEIWEQTEGKITTLVATMGTTGTLMGLARRLKEYNPDIRIVGVEPYLGHKLQGLKNMKEAYRPEIFEKERLDEKINIEDGIAFEMTRKLARTEGLFVGMSSGAAMAIACQQAESMKEGVIVTILPDGGGLYLSTPLFTIREEAGLKLYNSLTRSKEPFEPMSPGKVTMYSCGPTVNERLHIGNCRRFVFSDLLSRYLRFRGFDVTHVVNITDLDDKTISGSEQEGIALEEFTKTYVEAFMNDMGSLGIAAATHYPKASEHVDDMVKLAKRLVEKGVAYEKLRSLYFDISRFSNYGKLSGVDLDKIRLGATVDLDDYEKDNPRDFTLLKRAKLSEMKRGIFTRTEWGNIRPSWHIQCAAMSMKYLGETFDIHTSGRELIFPHHENEIAIAGALTGKPLANYWIHCERVLVDGKKVEQGQDGPFVEDLIAEGYSGKAIRYWLMASHYRKPLELSGNRLDEAASALNRVNACIQTILGSANASSPCPETRQLVYDLKNGFTSAMDDDLNISGAMAVIFTVIRKVNRICQDGLMDADSAGLLLDTLKQLDTVLNVFDFEASAEDADITELMVRRNEARERKDWDLADRLREQLRAMGVEIRDARTEPQDG